MGAPCTMLQAHPQRGGGVPGQHSKIISMPPWSGLQAVETGFHSDVALSHTDKTAAAATQGDIRATCALICPANPQAQSIIAYHAVMGASTLEASNTTARPAI